MLTFSPFPQLRKRCSPPLSLFGQLLWREFFYTAATNNPNFDRMDGNPICVQVGLCTTQFKRKAIRSGETCEQPLFLLRMFAALWPVDMTPATGQLWLIRYSWLSSNQGSLVWFPSSQGCTLLLEQATEPQIPPDEQVAHWMSSFADSNTVVVMIITWLMHWQKKTYADVWNSLIFTEIVVQVQLNN